MKNLIASKTAVPLEERSQIFKLFSGIMVAYAITCVIFIGYAILLTYTSITEKNISLVVTITTIISALVAGFDSARGAKEKGWFWGVIAGICYAVILIAIGTWFSEGFSFDARSVTLLILAIASGGLGGVLGINVKK